MMYSQQEIEQQIMAVRIIKKENELISYCRSLDLSFLIGRTAIEISKWDERFLPSYWESLNRSIPMVVTHKFSYNNLDDIDSSLMIICINTFGLDSDWVSHARILREGIDRCARIYIEQINSVRTAGYDWDVIIEMMGEDNIFTKLLKCGDKQELFEKIKKVFCGENEKNQEPSSREYSIQ